MKKDYQFAATETYFNCLDIYQPSLSYDEEEKVRDNSAAYALKPGDILLNRYRILRLLQKNEFGFVYLVEKTKKNKKFIIKEFFPHKFVTRNEHGEMVLNTPLDIESLMRFNYLQKFFVGEANHLEKLSIKSHENIVKVASIEKHINSTTYIIYPFEEGMTLQRFMEIKKRMGKEKLNKNEIDKILYPLLSAVEHLHSLDIYHLNIKPENILMKKDGSLLLFGFEASTFFTDEDSRVFCNAYTPQYAAPEQIEKRDFSEIGKASDIYIIGALFYRLITGNFPPSAKERIACQQKDIAYDPYISIKDKNRFSEEYDIAFLWGIDRALSFVPKERFRDITLFKKTLYPESVTKKTKLIKNKKYFLLYILLFLVFIYLIFEGLYRFESDRDGVSLKREENLSVSDTKKELEDNGDTRHDKISKKAKELNRDDNVSWEYDLGDERAKTQVYESKITEEIEVKRDIHTFKKQVLTDINETLGENEQKEIVQDDNSTIPFMKATTVQIPPDEISIQSQSPKVKKKGIYLEQEVLNEKNNTLLDRKGDLVENVRESIVSTQAKEIEYDENNTLLKKQIKKEKTVIKEKKPNTIKKSLKEKKKNIAKPIRKRKKKKIQKPKIEEKRVQQPRQPSAKRSTKHVWYCKAIGGTIRTSARDPQKSRAQSRALRECRKKAGLQKHCRILHCILIR